MGNFNNQSVQSQIPINFKELSISQHLILGEVRHIVNNHDETEYALIERVFASQTQLEKCHKKIKSRSKLSKLKQKQKQDQYVIEVVDCRSIEQGQFCSKTHKLFIFFKDFKQDLKSAFQERKYKNLFYAESQLLQISLKITNCLIEMSDLGLRPFHLSMESILMRKNTIKLIDSDLTNQMSPIDSLNFKSQLRKGTFIAPEMLTYAMQCQPNSMKSEIFTFGVIILSLMILRSVDEIYNYNTRTINFLLMDTLISQSPYSLTFKTIIKEMLKQYPDERIGVLRLKQSFTSLWSSTNNNMTINFTNNIGESEYKYSQTTTTNNNKGLIYLGKHPNARNNESFNQSNIITTTPQHHQRRNSYHKLLRDKSMIIRQKKSVSFTTVNNNHNNSSFLKEEFPRSILNNNHNQINYKNKDTPLTNVEVILTNMKEKKNQNGMHNHYDVSDIKSSDMPISPSTLQCKNVALGNDRLIVYGQPWSMNSNPYENVNYRITYQPQNQYNENQIEKNYNCEYQHQIEMKKQKSKITINLPSYQYNQVSFLLPEQTNVPTLCKLNFIEKLETPRVTKKIDLNDSNSKKISSQQKKGSEQTPIKSLQLMRTQKRQQNDHIMKQMQKIQEQKAFGRYDFSNGSVYEGEFNSQNEFQGNFSSYMEGNGTLYFSTGKVFYSGCWKKNQFHGFGILNNIQNSSQSPSLSKPLQTNYHNFNLNDNNLWTQYEGEFHEDKKHGFGTLYFANGDKFSGCFVNDSIEGFGNFYRSSNHQTIMGIWVENAFKES